MKKLSAIVLFAAALGVGVAVGAANAQQPAPATRTIKAISPGLAEVSAPRANEAVAAGIQKITATPKRSKCIRRGATSTSAGRRM